MTDQPLRIVQLVHRPQRRGAEVFARALNEQLRRSGHVATTAYLYGDFDDGLGEAPHERLLRGSENHLFERVPGWHPGLLRRLSRLLDELQPDIVQANGGRTLKYAARVAHGAGRHLVYRNIGDPRVWLHRPVHRFVYRRWIGPAIDAIATVSDRSVAPLRELYGAAKLIRVLPTAVDTASFVPRRDREAVRRLAETPAKSPVVIFAGSLTPEKRVDRLLVALAEARHRTPGLRLWIVGDGPLRGELELRARDLGVSASVLFLGLRDDLADLLAAADLMALTSDTEGIPGVVLEAGAVGLPTVATRVGGMAECVDDGRTGYLLEPEDTAGIAAKISALALDPALRRRLGAAARADVERRFDLPAIASRFVDLYRRVARGREG